MMKEEPLLILKPSLINAFLPTLIKYVLKTILYLGIPIGLIFMVINLLQGNKTNFILFVGIIIFGSIVISLISLAIKIFIFTPAIEYRFYKNHLELEKKLINIERKSVPYSKITNINSEISLWDRITDSGDLIIHTADENKTGSLEILFLKNPLEVEKKIQILISKPKKN